MVKQKIQRQNVGNAGEYYIASRLSALNFTATITLGRAERYDILAVGPTNRMVKISVKATQSENAKYFPLSEKDEGGASDDFYYAFVKLNAFKEKPDFWIIPSKVVCPTIKEAEERWMRTPGRSGKKHNTSSMRILPIETTEAQSKLFPKDWNEKVKLYSENFGQLL